MLLKVRNVMAALLLALIGVANVAASVAQKINDKERRVVIENDGWQLIGDLLVPPTKRKVPAVIMLNRAAGDRTEYAGLAARLAERGIASLRVDLRGHGESINKGRFIPFDQQSSELIIKPSHEDVTAIHRYLKTLPGIDPARIGFVGASYSGEAMAIAGRESGYGQAYVALSPGSFSDESMELIDRGSIPWLFVKSADERAAVMKDLFTILREKSRKAEIIEVAGTEHGSRILAAQPDITEMIAVWFKHNLSDAR